MNKNSIIIQHKSTSNKNSWTTVHPDLVATKDLIYDPMKFKCSEPIIETESSEYGGGIHLN